MPRPLTVHLPVVPGRAHNLYQELVEAPPEGVTYVFPQAGEVGFREAKGEPPSLLSRLRASRLVSRAYGPVLRSVLRGVGVKDRVDRLLGKRAPYDLYHSLGGLHALPEPWTVAPESSLDFFAFGDWHEEIRKPASRRYAQRLLLSRHCKRILPWNRAALGSIERTFPDAWPRLRAKCEVVPLAIRAGPEPPPEPPAPPYRLLFVGSRNFPQDFVPKGGPIAMEALRILRETRDDVELVVRAKVPTAFAERHRATPGLRILGEPLSDEDLLALYHSCHAFVFPAAYTPGMVFPEAMRAARPIVGFDVWANAEVVQDGRTGLLVAPPEGISYLNEFGYNDWGRSPEWFRAYEDAPAAARRIADAIERLLDDAALRRSMGAAARQEVVSGRSSIERRNATLRRVYDEALQS